MSQRNKKWADEVKGVVEVIEDNKVVQVDNITKKKSINKALKKEDVEKLNTKELKKDKKEIQNLKQDIKVEKQLEQKRNISEIEKIKKQIEEIDNIEVSVEKEEKQEINKNEQKTKSTKKSETKAKDDKGLNKQVQKQSATKNQIVEKSKSEPKKSQKAKVEEKTKVAKKVEKKVGKDIKDVIKTKLKENKENQKIEITKKIESQKEKEENKVEADDKNNTTKEIIKPIKDKIEKMEEKIKDEVQKVEKEVEEVENKIKDEIKKVEEKVNPQIIKDEIKKVEKNIKDEVKKTEEKIKENIQKVEKKIQKEEKDKEVENKMKKDEPKQESGEIKNENELTKTFVENKEEKKEIVEKIKQKQPQNIEQKEEIKKDISTSDNIQEEKQEIQIQTKSKEKEIAKEDKEKNIEDENALVSVLKNEGIKLYDDLDPVQQTKLEILAKEIKDRHSIIFFGAKAQENLNRVSETMLEKVKTKDLGEAGENLNRLVAVLKDFDIDELNPTKKYGFFARLFGKPSPVQKFLSKYDEVRVQIDRIIDDLEEKKSRLLTDITSLEKLYKANFEFIKILDEYIAAGAYKLSELEKELKELEKEAKGSRRLEKKLGIRDLRALITALEARIHDMKLSRVVALQSLPSIRLIQDNNKTLVEKINSTLANTLPLWKNQLAQAVAIFRSKKASESIKAAQDFTNELLEKNAEKLKEATKEITEQANRGVFDIESIKKANKTLISSINESLRITQRAKEARAKAEVELTKIEKELEEALIAAEKRKIKV